MATATMHRSAYGLSSPRDDRPWWARALCADRPEWTDDVIANLTGRGAATPGAAKLAHVCGHCPVFARCLQDTQERRPYGGVQAGLLWPSLGKRPVSPPDPGCGPWCPPVLAPVGVR